MTTRMMVKSEILNLRSTADMSNNDNIITKMPLGHEVKILAAPEGARFWEVETVINGETKKGFASRQFLREPLSAAKDKLLAAAVDEWMNHFDRGRGQEGDEPYYKRVGDYFRAINMNSDGKDHWHYWSAAFISFIARKAGYADFKFSDGHWEYIYDAKAKHLANKPNAPFWLFCLNEHKPQLGDLVCAWRNNVATTYDGVKNSFFPSHTDVIVKIDDDSVLTIGGNVGDSVNTKTFPLDANGYITAENKRFAIMRNNR